MLKKTRGKARSSWSSGRVRSAEARPAAGSPVGAGGVVQVFAGIGVCV